MAIDWSSELSHRHQKIAIIIIVVVVVGAVIIWQWRRLVYSI